MQYLLRRKQIKVLASCIPESSRGRITCERNKRNTTQKTKRSETAANRSSNDVLRSQPRDLAYPARPQNIYYLAVSSRRKKKSETKLTMADLTRSPCRPFTISALWSSAGADAHWETSVPIACRIGTLETLREAIYIYIYYKRLPPARLWDCTDEKIIHFTWIFLK